MSRSLRQRIAACGGWSVRPVVRGELVLRAGLALLVVLSLVAVSEACPSCKAALASSDGEARGDWVSGFFFSILFLLCMPFICVGSFAGYMYVLVRRQRNVQAQAASMPEVAPDRLQPAHAAYGSPAEPTEQLVEV